MKIYLIGTSCSGKSTLARRISEKLGIPHIELDLLWWLPGWNERNNEEFRELLTEKLILNDNWIVDGNYHRVRDLILSQADIIIWLNLPFVNVFWRSIIRTLGRIITGKIICNGNKEKLSALFSRDGMPAWIIRSYHQRKVYGAVLKATDQRVIELCSQSEIDFWFNSFSSSL